LPDKKDVHKGNSIIIQIFEAQSSYSFNSIVFPHYF
jgi:hypothetical protein